MKSYTVKLQTINEVNDFVNTLLLIKEDVDLTSERYVVNAKSIMGVFSLDLTKPLTAVIHGDDNERYESILSKFIVK